MFFLLFFSFFGIYCLLSTNHTQIQTNFLLEYRDGNGRKRLSCVGVIDILLDAFVFFCCVGKCCCRGKGKKSRAIKESRSVLYSGVTFAYSWCYFVGAIFLVPYAAQMALNTLATATAVTIFIKRKELSIGNFRVLTGVFLPMILFMSAYAVWTIKEEGGIDDVRAKSPDVKRFELGVFIAVVNGIWLVLSTAYIAIIQDEIGKIDVYYITKDSRTGKIISKVKVDSYVASRFGRRVADKLGSIMSLTHIIFGFFYIFLCVLFIRVNEVFTLELILYAMCLIIGAVSFEYFFLNNAGEHGRTLVNFENGRSRTKSRYETEKYRYDLASIEVCTQLFIFCLGVSGTRMLYALLGGLDFSYIFELPIRIIAATILCWGVLFYRTLEVIEWNVSHKHATAVVRKNMNE